jgi:serine/threonine protein kinase
MNDDSPKVDVAGSYLYMAPERLEGRTLSPEMDVWAYAIMFYEVCFSVLEGAVNLNVFVDC